MIYFIRSGQYVKIGVSARPWERLMEFQTANPEPLEMLAIAPGDYGFESELHKLFGEHRGVGEWFQDGDRIRAVVNFMRGTFPELQERLSPSIPQQPEEHQSSVDEETGLPTGPRRLSDLAAMADGEWRIETSANGNGRGLATWGWRRRGAVREYHYGGVIID